MINKFSRMVNENNTSKHKLGLDIHGVINTMPEFFAFLSESFVKNNGQVHIITGGSWTKKLEDLINSYNIKYTHKFSVYDYLLESGAQTSGEVEFPDGTIQKKFDNVLWDNTKAKYCSENGISLHIDDTSIYNNYFTTPFCRLWSHNNQPKSTHKDVRHLD
jgi:hypothetical protein